MQLVCPNCGENVPAENINIQQMAAVCSACDTVFQFDLPKPKLKTRKVKQPEHLDMRDTEDRLHLAFRTNVHLGKNENFVGVSVLTAAFTFISLLTLGGSLADDVPIFMAGSFLVVTLFLYYLLTLMVYNKTHIEMDDSQITVSRKPLPNPLEQPNTITLGGVEMVRFEETPASIKEGYDTPRYRVWAETESGIRKPIVNDVTEEYAIFIAQRLNERLHEGVDDAALNLARLVDDAPTSEIDDSAAQGSAQTRAAE